MKNSDIFMIINLVGLYIQDDISCSYPHKHILVLGYTDAINDLIQIHYIYIYIYIYIYVCVCVCMCVCVCVC